MRVQAALDTVTLAVLARVEATVTNTDRLAVAVVLEP